MTTLLTTATAAEETERDASVAVLPIGSFEQHGDYLPLVTDTVVACAIAQEIAEAYRVLLLPPVTISCSHEHSAWRGTVSISSQTLYHIVMDVAESTVAAGITHLVLINGHGGNYVLGNVVQEYTAKHGPHLHLFPQAAQWSRARVDANLATTSHEDMHAGELETSILLKVAPELVRAGYQSADWEADDRPLLLTSGMTAYTKSGVIGRPSQGSADKGEMLLHSLTEQFDSLRLLPRI